MVLELHAQIRFSNISYRALGRGNGTLAFGAKTPLTAEKADFIADVLLNEYWFIAAPGREFANAAQVDRPGVKIGVGLNTSSDQFLSRTLKSAQLVRGVDAMSRRYAAANWMSGRRAPVVFKSYRSAVSGAKIVPGAFTSDRTMLILPKGRSSAAQAKVIEIVTEAKKTGVVRKALEQTGVTGVRAHLDRSLPVLKQSLLGHCWWRVANPWVEKDAADRLSPKTLGLRATAVRRGLNGGFDFDWRKKQ